MSLGTHVLCDFYDCSPEKISDNEAIEQVIIRAINESGACIVEPKLYYFEPYGLTGVVIITESHFSIHTWPEYKYVAIDYFTCSNKIEIDKTIEILKEYFEPDKVELKEIKRGG